MIKKKVCMLGAFAAGKTSLVQQYVHKIFSDKYHTTVGVNIEKIQVSSGDTAADLIIWDLHGEDDFQHVRLSYLTGSSGCVYVVDGTRRATLATALGLKDITEDTIGKVPCLIIINKADLKESWEIDTAAVKDIKKQGINVIETSAKTGDNVEAAFKVLLNEMLGNKNGR